MIVTLPDPLLLQAHIMSNVVAGDVETSGPGVLDEHLTASGSELGTSLATYTNVLFHTNEFLYFRKAP